jgi:hypothetical protein
MDITSPVIILENSAHVVQSYGRKKHEKTEEIKPRRRQRSSLLVSTEMSRGKIN